VTPRRRQLKQGRRKCNCKQMGAENTPESRMLVIHAAHMIAAEQYRDSPPDKWIGKRTTLEENSCLVVGNTMSLAKSSSPDSQILGLDSHDAFGAFVDRNFRFNGHGAPEPLKMQSAYRPFSAFGRMRLLQSDPTFGSSRGNSESGMCLDQSCEFPPRQFSAGPL